MRSLDIKSLLIGILATALVAVMLGAGQQPGSGPRYQISAAANEKTAFVLDNESQKVFVIYKKADSAKWSTFDEFILNDTLLTDQFPQVKH